tara:strand:+ start:616 stop:1500 length:885 start_codon:yes stop_codon:yes gene_type:complete
LSYQNTTVDDRNKVIKYIQNADYHFIIISMFFGLFSHISRAIRWTYLLVPLGYKPRLVNSILAVLIGYLSNLGIPRSGELLRATVMNRYDKIPFQKGFGTVIAERVIDLIILFVFVCIALLLQFDLIVNTLDFRSFNLLQFLIIVLVFSLGFGALMYSKSPLLEKFKLFLTEIWKGVISIKKIKKKRPFIFHTIFIWVMYMLMFGVIKYTIPETSNLGLNALIPAFVIGGLSISITNGGIGIYPYTVSLVLISFGISKDSSLAFGWIVWSCQTLMILTFGAVAFFALPLINRQR